MSACFTISSSNKLLSSNWLDWQLISNPSHCVSVDIGIICQPAWVWQSVRPSVDLPLKKIRPSWPYHIPCLPVSMRTLFYLLCLLGIVYSVCSNIPFQPFTVSTVWPHPRDKHDGIVAVAISGKNAKIERVTGANTTQTELPIPSHCEKSRINNLNLLRERDQLRSNTKHWMWQKKYRPNQIKFHIYSKEILCWQMNKWTRYSSTCLSDNSI